MKPESNNTNPIVDSSQAIQFSSIDIHFARFLSHLADHHSQSVLMAAALANDAVLKGNVCIDIAEYAGRPVLYSNLPGQNLTWPELDSWLEHLKNSGVVGIPGDFRPLILDKTNLYIYRYWRYEHSLARSIQAKAGGTTPVDTEKLRSLTEALFPDADGPIDWQRVAAIIASCKKLLVISGGPGTGKTSTVARIIALLLQLSEVPLRIALTAPTGKAAARLKQSIQTVVEVLPISTQCKSQFPRDTSTLHRLLGTMPGSPYFRHTKDSPLPFDVVIVDEASMVDLALMAKLVEAVPEDARLILLGDKNQLSSVEAGAVLGDLCDAGCEHELGEDVSRLVSAVFSGYNLSGTLDRPMADCMVTLRKSFRFEEKSGIGLLASLINEGNAEGAFRILESSSHPNIVWRKILSENTLLSLLEPLIEEYFVPLCHENDPRTALGMLDRFRILCAIRQGPYGIDAVNNAIERFLISSAHVPKGSSLVSGQPIMVTQNDYSMDLYNGDTGILLSEISGTNAIKACFESPESPRFISPGLLPRHEKGYANTVHKSQGAEFDSVLLILPPFDLPVLSRELLYTAVTRARKKVEIWCNEGIFKAIVKRKINRRSGLRESIWGVLP